MRWALAALLSLTFTGVPIRAEENPILEYRVTDSEGETGFVPQGKSDVSPVKTDLVLQPGDRLLTGKSGRVEFATREGTVLELKENSSLQVDDFSSGFSKFFLRVGRLLGKFAPSSKSIHTTNIRTPIAVAAVRGTELALAVEENGETQAGVIEGKVAFGPIEAPSTEAAPNETAVSSGAVSTGPDWSEGEVVLEESQGLVIKPLQRPARLKELPPVVVKDMAWFPKIRERVPALRERWKDLPAPAKQEIREQTLRERVRWEVPPQRLRELKSPRQRMGEKLHRPNRPQPKRRLPGRKSQPKQ